ncbi:MAG: helix-turn-helix domain-containing protein [Candidatus Levyibacteriota bacterium]
MKNISQILKEEREKKGLSIGTVVEALKIRKNFIVDIENGNFNSLPSESYAMGFVKNYAAFLGISSNRAAALFRREYESKNIEVIPKFKKTNRLPGRRFILRSPRSYLILGVTIVVLCYIMYQFSFLFVGPKLTLSSPENGSVVSANTVMVAGKTDPYATVTVNTEDVYVDLSGSFKTTLYVYSGNNTVTVLAKNRYGKETKKEVQIVVK